MNNLSDFKSCETGVDYFTSTVEDATDNLVVMITVFEELEPVKIERNGFMCSDASYSSPVKLLHELTFTTEPIFEFSTISADLVKTIIPPPFSTT